jgi:hypothetical protein
MLRVTYGRPARGSNLDSDSGGRGCRLNPNLGSLNRTHHSYCYHSLAEGAEPSRRSFPASLSADRPDANRSRASRGLGAIAESASARLTTGRLSAASQARAGPGRRKTSSDPLRLLLSDTPHPRPCPTPP